MSYKVFLSSPSDVEPERDAVERAIERINAEHLDDEPFELVRWESSYYTADDTFQQQIVKPSDCELVVCIFWKRLGSDLPDEYARQDGTLPTGSEYEFEEALEGASLSEDKLPDVLVYRKTAQVHFSEENLEYEKAQRDRFLQFWRRWFRNEKGHFVAAFQSFAETEEFASLVEEHLRLWLRNRSDEVVWTTGSPYRGLEPFDVEHEAIFFGRSRETERARARLLTNCLAGERFLLVLGPSGSGKSSLVRAGLIPRLARAGGLSDLADHLRWAITTPMAIQDDWATGLAGALFEDGALAAELSEGDFDTPESLGGLLRRGGAEASAPIRKALERATRGEADGDTRAATGSDQAALLLFIDQLEEVFAWPVEEAVAFLETLSLLAMEGTAPILVVATMRSDFQHRLIELPPLQRLAGNLELRGPDEIERTLEIGLPSPADLREMIVGPARAAGLTFETSAERDRDLQRILEEEAKPTALPAVQFLLSQLYERRHNEQLTLGAYDTLGGSGGVMATRGEEVLAALGADGEEAFPRVARALVTRTGTDAPATALRVPQDNFGEDTAEARLVAALKEASLLMSDRGEVRIAHESLIVGWKRLRELVDSERRLFESRDRLLPYFWRYRDTPPSEGSARRDRLLTGFQLAEGRELLEQWGPSGLADTAPGLPEFITASIARDNWKRRRNLVIGWSVSAVFAALSFLMYNFWTEARRARIRSDAALQVVQSQTALRAGDVAAAVGHGVGALDTLPSVETRSTALTALMELSSHLQSTRQTSGTVLGWTDADRLFFISPEGEAGVVPVGPAASAAAAEPRTVDFDEEGGEIVHARAIGKDAMLVVFFDGTVRRMLRSADGLWEVEEEASRAQAFALGTPHGVAVGGADRGTVVAIAGFAGVAVRRCGPAGDPASCAATVVGEGKIESVAVSPDARWLAVGRGGDEGGVDVYDLAAEAIDGAGPAATVTVAVDGEVIAISWSATGDRLALGTRSGRLVLLDTSDVETGALVETEAFAPSTEPVATVAWSPAAAALAYTCGSFDLCVRRYSSARGGGGDGAPVTRRFAGHRNLVSSLAWSPDGARLASIDDDGILAVWTMEADSRVLTSVESGRQVTLNSVAVDRAHGRVAAAADDGAVLLWSGIEPWAAPRRLAPPPGVGASAVALAFAPDGALAVVYEDTGVAIRAGDDGSVVRWEPVAGRINRLAWIDGGERVAAPVLPESIVLIPRTGEATTLIHETHGKDPRSVIELVAPPGIIANYTDGSMWKWTSDGERLEEPIVTAEAAGPGAEGAMSLAIDVSGRWLAATRNDDLIRLFDLSGKLDPLTLPLRSSTSKTVAFAPDGRLFAVLGADGYVSVWRLDGAEATPWFSVPGAPVGRAEGASARARQVTWIDWWDAEHLVLSTVNGSALVLNTAVEGWRQRAAEGR